MDAKPNLIVHVVLVCFSRVPPRRVAAHRKFDSAVKIVLPLGGGVAREVLWDQSLSSGKSESLGHGYGNLTLNFLPAGVSVGANLTPSEVELRQQVGHN